MNCEIVLSWDPAATPEPLGSLLRALAGEYPIVEGPADGAVAMTFQPGGQAGRVQVDLEGAAATIRYDQPCRAARGVGALLAGLVKPGTPHAERSPFETFGIMLDCSRNAVMTVEHFKLWLRRLALLGYNMAMLYTEQTYELPGEPYFGYLRGRYSDAELQQMDEYAASVGIELIGCIQTLGHLANTLKWDCYNPVRDTSSVLLVDEPATYELIAKMIAAAAGNLRSRRIHIGMDEAWDLGRGKFLDKNDYQRQFDIFNRHLGRVIEICKGYDLSPMIWSDMYFRMGSKTGSYYDTEAQIPADVREAIPPEVRLVYWDYYHQDEQAYLDFIRAHRELGSEPVMASGVWTWRRQLWYDPDKTEATVGPCVRACRQAKVKDLFFTLWGDDGAYCEFDSALAGLAYGADLAYAEKAADSASLEKRFAAVCRIDYQSVIDLGRINGGPSVEPGGPAIGGPVLWDDPLLGIYFKACKHEDKDFWQKQADYYADLLGKLTKHAEVAEPVDLAHGVTLGRLLLAKVQLKLALDAAYQAGDKADLKRVAQQVPVVVEAIDKALASFRRQWYRRNKPFGFEVIQIRLGGLRARYLELGRRIAELLAGQADRIDELDEVPEAPGASKLTWQGLATGGTISGG